MVLHSQNFLYKGRKVVLQARKLIMRGRKGVLHD